MSRPSRQRRQKIPHWLEKRPMTTTGVAIPWMHTEENDEEEKMNVMAFMNPDKVATAIHFRRCGVCGVKISPLESCYFMSPRGNTNCAFVTPPMHDTCIEYYLQNHEQLHHDLKIEAVDDLHQNMIVVHSTRFHAEWEDEIDGFVVYLPKDSPVKGTNAVNYRKKPLVIDVAEEE